MKTAIDVHVHLAGLPDGKNGCYISPKMLRSPLFRFLLSSFGIDINNPTEGCALYLQTLVQRLRDSRFVKQAVVLAMDGVYDATGQFDPKETHFLVPNDFVFSAVDQYPNELLAGISINPARADAIAELDRCAVKKPYLLKALPNSQQFNPANPAFRPFWKAMAKYHIPFLSHVGYEFSLLGKDQSVGDPDRLRPALEEGVTVIAAHGASFGLFFYEKYWKTLCAMVSQYRNFYWDASALSLPNRAGMLLRLRRRPELLKRMVFGSDYPLPIFCFPAILAGRPSSYFELRKIRNPFDRHYRLLQVLDLPVATSVLPRCN